MGRRTRARERERAAAAAAARAEAAAPAGAPARRRPNWLRLLNPFKLRELTRSRARAGAIGFGLSGVVFAVAGWATGEPAWFSSAVLLGILTLAWGVTAALLPGGDRSS
jgi:hypothetical protein